VVETCWQDDYAQTMEKRIRFGAMLTSLIAGILILALKMYSAHISDSSALRSDALEGAVNVLAAAFGLGSMIFAEKPADQDHPYGHGKIEYFSSAFEGGLISLAGFLILLDVGTRLFHPAPMENLGLGLQLNVLAGFLNGILGFAILKIGKKYRSQILVADGMHLLTDLVSTGILGIGLVIVLYTGWTWLDPVLAVGVALFLFKTGFGLVKSSAGALLDAEDPLLLQGIVDQLNQIDRGQVITVHELRAQQFGRDKHVDIHVVVPEYLTVKQAHHATDDFVRSLRKELGQGSLIHTHVDPCERDYCSECPLADCPIRLSPFIARKPLSLETATRPGEI
jgi:cation diffusion facilitator family transporter